MTVAPSKQWEEMTEAEKVEWLAVEVMGWEKAHPAQNCWMGEKPEYKFGKRLCYWDWNPLTDWNHFRQLEEKVMEDEKLWSAYIALHCCAMQEEGISEYARSDLSARSEMLYLAYQSLHD